jgi:hypothetical protein
MKTEKTPRDSATPLLAMMGRGRTAPAKYQPTGIPRYDGNPYIEALPPILSSNDAAKAMAYYPVYKESERLLPPELRDHLIHTALDVFIPLPEHLDLQQRFSCLIRGGYCRRNPVAQGFWGELDSRVASLSAGKLMNRSLATGMSIIGISGGGKTSATEAILGLMPQVIHHSAYDGTPLTNSQVVWLKLQCPYDGSVRGLCIAFFTEMDHLLGTNHLRNYGSGRRTVDELLPNMARVASIHGLGVLVIDEIQHLSQSKSGGKERMLNFFCQLVNTIGVPVVFIGTFKAMGVLGDEFRQIRRGTGEGDFVWDRMLNDEKWKFFIEGLWTYQYVRKPTPLTKELTDVLYEESQGITDFAVKLYMLAQVRAISSKKEVITPSIIRSVATDSLRLAQPVLRALRNGDTTALQLLSDVQPIDFAAEARRIRSVAEACVVSKQPAPVKATTSEERTNGADAPKKAQRRSTDGTTALPDLLASAGSSGISPYDALKAADLVANSSEFLVHA